MYRQIKYSSVWANEQSGVGHGRGRLNSPQGWSAGVNRVGEWMQIDTGEVQSIAGVVVQGRAEAWVNQRVTTFRVKISKDGSAWQDVECNRVFDGCVLHHANLTRCVLPVCVRTTDSGLLDAATRT